jgi:hypothetical protein
VGAEGQVGHDGPEPGGGHALGDAAPQRAVDEQAVDEHDRGRRRVAQVLVLDGAVGQGGCGHVRASSFVR